MKRLLSLLILFFSLQLFSQNNNLPAESNVYNFLQYLSVKGIITNYDDMIIPKTKKEIWDYLTEAENSSLISKLDLEIIIKYKAKLSSYFNSDKINSDIIHNYKNFISDSGFVHLYYYKNSGSNFFIKPEIQNSFLYSFKEKAPSDLFSFGVNLEGNYSDWFGFSFSASNGIQKGNREVALNNNILKQSFSFSNTKLNNFDYTEGYFNLVYKKLKFELGRERILWGRGNEKLFLSLNPQVFDFIKFSAQFDYFSFDHMHGWLVQPTYTTFDSSLGYNVKNKNPKYIAISRFGFKPSRALNFGITQSIIYANRPFELAYLNPFLFLESAQRSLNDLDNSFLALDAKYIPVNGFSISSAINFDDLNFKTLGSEGFGSIQNRFSWQFNLDFTHPLILENMKMSLDFIEFRPYMYTHFGSGESTLYTNNGYFLGPDLEPNSYKISVNLLYYFSKEFTCAFNFGHYEHGSNIYDGNGNLIRNVGGNIMQFIRLEDARKTALLDGELQVINSFYVITDYEIFNDFRIGLSYMYNHDTRNLSDKNYFNFSVKLSTF